MTFSDKDIPDLSDQVIIVTGGNAGLGEVTARVLAHKGAKVYILTRSESRYTTALEAFASEDKASAERWAFIQCDLADLNTVKIAAETFLKREERLDVLINNAGIMATPYSLSKQGIEATAAINAVGPGLLTFLLLPLLVATSRRDRISSVRIVHLSSSTHSNAKEAPEELWNSIEKINNSSETGLLADHSRYNRSKLTNILLADIVAQLTRGERITSMSVDPGFVQTNISAHLGAHYNFFLILIFNFLRRLAAAIPLHGALTALYAATSADIDRLGLNGAYLVPTAKVGKKSRWAEDSDGKGRAAFLQFLKEMSQSSVGVDIDDLIEKALKR